jgi:hypothetical protein
VLFKGESELAGYKADEQVKIVMDGQTELSFTSRRARDICDLLAILAYDESIIGLIAKYGVLADELEELKTKLFNCQQYLKRRKRRGKM